jgi:riboflavin kinase/FMN adenylyltransferase
MTRGPSVITVGNFDGVHLGHRALIEAARRLAAPAAGRVVAVTFTRNPLATLRPDRCPPSLMDAVQREQAMKAAGVDEVVWLEPTPDVLGLSPRQFVEKITAAHEPIGWVEGPDFRFGQGRAGDVALLKELGQEKGFDVEVVEPREVTLGDQLRVPVSSTLVRWLVACGRVADAAIGMGRPFVMRGEVVQGEQRGRTIGFPTANIDTGDRVLPADGVYGGTVVIDGREHAAAISVGEKPTFGKRQRTFEAFVLDHAGDLYGRTLEIAVVRWLRDQAVFPGVESLIVQMNRDVERVHRWHEAGSLAPTIMR